MGSARRPLRRQKRGSVLASSAERARRMLRGCAAAAAAAAAATTIAPFAPHAHWVLRRVSLARPCVQWCRAGSTR